MLLGKVPSGSNERIAVVDGKITRHTGEQSYCAIPYISTSRRANKINIL